MRCKSCGAQEGSTLWKQNQDERGLHYELKAVAARDMGDHADTVIADAGIFCSKACAARYLMGITGTDGA